MEILCNGKKVPVPLTVALTGLLNGFKCVDDFDVSVLHSGRQRERESKTLEWYRL